MKRFDVRVAAGDTGGEHAAPEREFFAIFRAQNREFDSHVCGFVVTILAGQSSTNLFAFGRDGVEPVFRPNGIARRLVETFAQFE